MGIITNYGDLKTAVGDEINRKNLVDKIPGFIRRAEKMVNRELRVPAMEEIATGTLSSSTLALPSLFLETIDLMVNNGAKYVPLVRNEYRRVRESQGNTSGIPKYYVERDEEIIVAPGPDSSYAYELLYYKSFADFSADSDTNWVIDNAPELYLYGALVDANAFLKDLEMIGYWSERFNERIAELKRYTESRKYPGGSLQVVTY
jgi:hypothetical protein